MNLLQKKKSKTSLKPAENNFSLGFLFDMILLFINLLVVGCLFLGDAACFISPEKFLLPSYLGLSFPIITIVAILFMLFWVIRRKWYFLVSLLSLLFVHTSVWNTFPVNFKKEIPENTISVLSYNIHLFDFYTSLSENEILDYIYESDADIVCLQEFGYSNNPKKKFLKKSEILEKLGKKYPYHHIDLSSLQKNNSYGVATFSKYPIKNKQHVNYTSKYNSTIYSDIDINGDLVRVFNCHLESNNVTENDKELIANLGEEFKNEKMNEIVNHLSRKLGQSFKLRAKQAEKIAAQVTRTEIPIILCGDFNDVPVSYAYATIRGDKLKNSFTESGTGYGHTFNEKFFWFRIDHILHSSDFQSFDFTIDKVRYSDHYPIKCYLSLKKQP
jgi:endonuclease/exonuclease/phosphatase family metal-dependent hydrolase